jgi:hypothetical protein
LRLWLRGDLMYSPAVDMGPELQTGGERDVWLLCQARDYDAAATAALRAHGPEVMRFLRSSHKSEDDAADVFSVFAEDLWRSMMTFAWECSLRTWAYVLARRASFRALLERALRLGAAIAKTDGGDAAGAMRVCRAARYGPFPRGDVGAGAAKAEVTFL